MDERANTPKIREIAGLDLLRLFAAMMVLFTHLGFWDFWSEQNFLAVNLKSEKIAEILAPISFFGWVGVEIFFVISGFVIAYSANSATAFSFARGRVARIYPAAWISAPITLIAVALTKPSYFPHSQLLKLFVKTFFIWPHGPWLNAVIWTLPVELCFYVLIFSLIALQKFKHIGVVVSCIGLCSSIYWSAYAVALLSGRASLAAAFVSFSRDALGQLSLLHYGCFFALGTLLWLNLIKGERRTAVPMLIFIVFGCTPEIVSVSNSNEFHTNILMPAYVPVLVWYGAIGLIILSVKYNERVLRLAPNMAKFSRSCGLLTYPLYLLHRPVAFITIYLLMKLRSPSPVAWLSGFVMALIVSAGVAFYLEPILQRWVKLQFDRVKAQITNRGNHSAGQLKSGPPQTLSDYVE